MANFADHLIPAGKLAQDTELVDFGLKQQGASNVLQLECIVPGRFLAHRIWQFQQKSKESVYQNPEQKVIKSRHFELSNECY